MQCQVKMTLILLIFCDLDELLKSMSKLRFIIETGIILVVAAALHTLCMLGESAYNMSNCFAYVCN